MASLNPVSYILKTSVTRSSSLAESLGACGGTFSLGSFLVLVVPVPVVAAVFVVSVIVLLVNAVVFGGAPSDVGTPVVVAVVEDATVVAIFNVCLVQQPLIE